MAPRSFRPCVGGTVTPDIAQCRVDLYEEELVTKVRRVTSQLAEAAGVSEDLLPSPTVFRSDRLNFRMRATFKLWHENDTVYYVMFDKEGYGHDPLEVIEYPMGSRRICELMPQVLAHVRQDSELRAKVDYCSFLTTLNSPDDALIVLTYNRPIDQSAWGTAARAMADALGGSIKVVGRSKHVKVVIGGEEVTETLHVPGRGDCVYAQTEGCFTQPNARVCEQMLGWAYAATQGGGNDGGNGDLCELYCGSACFTIALAPNFRRVVATEVSKASVALAAANLAANQVTNVKVARLSAEEFVEALGGARRFARLEEAGLGDLNAPGAYRFTTLLVDPPRAGLDSTCLGLAKRFDRVVYISCNPETLCRDVQAFSSTHAVTRTACFDQFPYTPHLECGVVLERVSTPEKSTANGITSLHAPRGEAH